MKNNQIISQYQSFSGADYRFVFYLPLNTSVSEIQKVRNKIKEEIDSLQNTKLKDISSFVFPSSGSDIVDQEGIAGLKKMDDILKKFESNQVPIVLDSIQTLSYQIHTDIQPVRSLKFKYPKGYCVGQRLIAGSIIATILDEHPFLPLMEFNNLYNFLASSSEENYRKYDLLAMLTGVDNSSSVVDELPPINIIIQGANEQGDQVQGALYGVKLINDGSVISAQDMITEQTFSFVARDLDHLRNQKRGIRNDKPNLLGYRRASSILNNEYSQAKRAFKRGLNL